MPTTPLSENAQQGLATWHQLMAQNALEKLEPLLSNQVVFRSPAAHTPYPGKDAIKLVLKTVTEVFSDFRYHREFTGDDGCSVVLEFSANVGDKSVKGIDMIRFDDDGKIVEFEVMIRPLSGLQALAGEMGKRVAPYLAMLKGEGA
ncbi:nuclear transport factor 2 family protein [Marinobacter mobilis]|uniref:SnoaL-like domain-containing protein n=1 Tax=Marinobacter mobilis TaxID=488533 RepID=A0A1H2SKP7_9GAMM|nr:nuclear transport factor 2 family protein [Marinobacter mobilis]SDW32162.1 SnoaL-like domain-containing protein [Marinobacter mobilis]